MIFSHYLYARPIFVLDDDLRYALIPTLNQVLELGQHRRRQVHIGAKEEGDSELERTGAAMISQVSQQPKD